MGKALDQAVVPFLGEAGFTCDRKANVLVTKFTHNDFRHEVWIKESAEGQVMTLMEEVCRLQDSRARLNEIANSLNGTGPGKYIVHDDGRVEFYPDHLWTEEPCPSGFKQIFDAALALVEGRHALIMRMAWGGLTLDEALRYEGRSKKRRSRMDRQIDAILRKTLHTDPGEQAHGP